MIFASGDYTLDLSWLLDLSLLGGSDLDLDLDLKKYNYASC